MEKVPCQTCGKKTTKLCGLCEQSVCKTCAHNIGKDFFVFLKNTPDELKHGYYCHPCFSEHVSETYQTYEITLEKAKNMEVFFKRKHSRLVSFFKKAHKPVILKDCVDYDQMILHLAFLAAELGYNTIVNVEASSRKIHDGSYKTLLWSGSATPAHKN